MRDDNFTRFQVYARRQDYINNNNIDNNKFNARMSNDIFGGVLRYLILFIFSVLKANLIFHLNKGSWFERR